MTVFRRRKVKKFEKEDQKFATPFLNRMIIIVDLDNDWMPMKIPNECRNHYRKKVMVIVR